MAEYKGRTLHLADDIGNGKCLSGAGDAQEDLGRISAFDPFDQLPDRFGLIAGGYEIRFQFKFHLAPDQLFMLSTAAMG
jgi:hypothetical protein